MLIPSLTRSKHCICSVSGGYFTVSVLVLTISRGCSNFFVLTYFIPLTGKEIANNNVCRNEVSRSANVLHLDAFSFVPHQSSGKPSHQNIERVGPACGTSKSLQNIQIRYTSMFILYKLLSTREVRIYRFRSLQLDSARASTVVLNPRSQ